MKKQRILHVTYGSVRHAPRLIHAGQSGAENGYEVHVIGAPREPFPPQSTQEEINQMQAYLIPMLTRVHILDLLKSFKSWLSLDLGNETTSMPHGRNKLRTVLNIFFFNLWILRFGAKLKPDLVHCHELWGLPASLMLAKFRRVPIIYDVWDPYFLHHNLWRNRIVGSIERFLSRRADAIITASERMKKHFMVQGGKNVEYIGNWKRLSDYDSIEPAQIEELREKLEIPEDALIVSYIGLLYERREIPALLKAMELVDNVILLIGGRGTHRQLVVDTSQKLSNIRWLGWVDLADVPLYTKLSDVIYCCLKEDIVAHYVVANKMFETFLAGKIMLATYGLGEMSETLENTETGYLIKENSSQVIANALTSLQNRDLLECYMENSIKIRDQYSWERGERLLHNLYSRLLNKK